MEWTPNESQHTKLTLENKILPPLLKETRTRNLLITCPALYQQALPAPQARDIVPVIGVYPLCHIPDMSPAPCVTHPICHQPLVEPAFRVTHPTCHQPLVQPALRVTHPICHRVRYVTNPLRTILCVTILVCDGRKLLIHVVRVRVTLCHNPHMPQ